MPSIDPGHLSERLQHVATHERAARWLLDGPTDLGVVVWDHLRAGWLAVMEVSAGQGEGPTDTLEVALGLSPEVARDVVAFVRPPQPGSVAPGPDVLESQLFRLENARRRLTPRTPSRARSPVVLLGGGALLLAGAVLIFGVLRPVWEVTYFADPDLTVAHSSDRVRRLGGFWGLRSAAAGLARDHFSSRWRACAVFSENGTATLTVGSDDGSRLFVDGELVIDNWRTGTHREVVRRHPVRRGTHEIVIEHFDAARFASLTFDALVDRGELDLVAPAADGCPP